ncbi:MAG: 3-oxo-tetronate kinase [Pikeienuella sp.]
MKLGCIADDFTGATDLANTLVKGGMRVVQVIGVPDPAMDVGDADAVVVALKSRTAPAAEAVSESLDALEWLRAGGAQQIFFKYCSTFDSTAEGNIGPVADALMAALETDFALVCPAFPENGRTIFNGYLFVGDLLLSDSSMKDHPLTPMTDASLVRVMAGQSAHDVGLIALSDVRGNVAGRIEDLRRDGVRYGVSDAVEDSDLYRIGTAAKGHALITGGSGVALGLPANFGIHPDGAPAPPQIAGRSLVLAGSCSVATRAQITAARKHMPVHEIDVDAVMAGEDVSASLVDWALSQPEDNPVLIYSSADPAVVGALQAKYGRAETGEAVERVMGQVACTLVAQGFGRIVVAGGETSGAVVLALGVTALRIGPEIDPGVPWCETVSEQPVAMALKSGNFGGEDFFSKAFGLLP